MKRTPTYVTLAVLAVALPLTAASSASALGQISYGGCISNDGSGGLCGPTNDSPLKGAEHIALSPDGKTAYVASSGSSAVAVLDRSPGGQLTYAGCVSDDGSGGACADLPANALSGTQFVAVSPDGKSVYASAFNTSAVAVFDRAPGGQITYAGCVASKDPTGACADLPGEPLKNPRDLSVSPDGTSVYVGVPDGITVLDRAPGGQLTYGGCVSNDGSGGLCADAPGTPLRGPNRVEVSPGGSSVYVAAFNSDAITVFNRAAGGQITYAGCVSDDGSGGLCADAPGTPLATANSVTVSPEGNSVYVTSLAGNSLAVFDRAQGGQITYAGCVSNDGSGGLCADASDTALSRPTSVAVSPDGDSVYASAFNGAVTALDRAPGGQVTFAGCVSDDGSGGLCADATGTPLTGATSVAVSPDGTSLYASAFSAGTVTHFFRKTAPQTSIDSGPAEGSVIANRQPSFTFSADQAGAGFECSVDGGTFATCPSPTTTNALADGAHSIAVRAKTGGDVDSTPARRAFRVDATGPSVRIVKAPKKKVRSAGRKRRVRFAFTASEAGASFKCKLDRQRFKPCDSPKRFKVGRGKHRFVVKATDSLGNTGNPVRRTFRVVKKKG
jgi:DNA-binding beta-propeller fold protein YncE